MQAISTIKLTPQESTKILLLEEGHFVDLKSKDVSPAKLTKSLSAFANAEGGELFVGIDEDVPQRKRTWQGFDRVEDANGLIQCFETLFPLGIECNYGFLESSIGPGSILKVEIRKSRDVKLASDGKVYLRRGAQSLPVVGEESLTRLKRNKGIASFETEPVPVDKALITNSDPIIKFMLEVVPTAEPEPWLKKQQVIVEEKPTVAGLLLFADEPQAAIPKRCGLKIYRYKTKDDEGSRETLDFDPMSIEGCAYDQIKATVQKATEIIEAVRINTPSGLTTVAYPSTALHEVITNAVLHRDYSIADDIHIGAEVAKSD